MARIGSGVQRVALITTRQRMQILHIAIKPLIQNIIDYYSINGPVNGKWTVVINLREKIIIIIITALQQSTVT